MKNFITNLDEIIVVVEAEPFLGKEALSIIE